MNSTALIIDPDGLEGAWLAENLKKLNMQVDQANGNTDGLHCVLESPPALILLANETPPIEGEECLTVLRRVSQVPIVVLGSGGDFEQVEALNNGADVYLRRPFSQDVLLAWIKTLMWRRGQRNPDSNPKLNLGSISSLPLSATERRLALSLLARDGNLVTSKELLQETWGGKAGSATLVFYLRRLRQKLAVSSTNVKLISVRGLGHRLVSTN